MPSITPLSKCRGCQATEFDEIIDLGEQEVISLGDKERITAPLTLIKCKSCNLVQLKHSVDRDFLYRTYYYRSGTTETMRNHLKGIVDDVMKRVTLKEGDMVVDIGSNDGTLLSYYPSEVRKRGFEPSNIGDDVFDKSGIPNLSTSNRFFSAFAYNDFSLDYEPVQPRAKVITAIAMFYDLEDPNAFLQDIKKVLAPDGLFVIQMNYLGTMLQNNAVDNISHEHLCYYSLTSLTRLLHNNGLAAFDVTFSSINGGSFRVYVRHKEVQDRVCPGVTPNIMTTAEHEWAIFGDGKDPYKDFARRVRENAYKLRVEIVTKTVKGKRIYVLGTSTRGAVLMQLSGLDNKLIPFAVERDPAKHGKTYVGNIPIISEEQARQSPPDAYLVLPYWFQAEIIEREKEFLLNGGKLIFPLPVPYTVSVDKI